MALSTTVSVQVAATLTTALDLVTSSAPLDLRKRLVLATGAGANQADRIWHDRRTVAASGTDSLDLAGSLEDALGGAFTPARVKGLLVVAAEANANNVVVTRPASNGVPIFSAAGDAVPVRPGGLLLWVAPDATGVAVTGGTGDLIDIVNSAGGSSVTYDIVLLGASA